MLPQPPCDNIKIEITNGHSGGSFTDSGNRRPNYENNIYILHRHTDDIYDITMLQYNIFSITSKHFYFQIIIIYKYLPVSNSPLTNRPGYYRVQNGTTSTNTIAVFIYIYYMNYCTKIHCETLTMMLDPSGRFPTKLVTNKQQKHWVGQRAVQSVQCFAGPAYYNTILS